MRDQQQQQPVSWTLRPVCAYARVGCLVVAGILGNGIYAMYEGDKAKSQRMMRARVIGQVHSRRRRGRRRRNSLRTPAPAPAPTGRELAYPALWHRAW